MSCEYRPVVAVFDIEVLKIHNEILKSTKRQVVRELGPADQTILVQSQKEEEKVDVNLLLRKVMEHGAIVLMR